MNSVLKRLIETQQTLDGDEVVPLHSHMGVQQGQMIARAISTTKAVTGIEIGCAYGLSALFACEALQENSVHARHIVMDPCQSTTWRGLGLKHCREAGYEKMLEFYEEPSELCLPRLLKEGRKVDFAIIDGWHTFDHALVDFFYVNRMLNVGGIILLDDTFFKSLNRLARYLLNYPAYRLWSIGHNDPEVTEFCRLFVANQSLPVEEQKQVDWKNLPPKFFGHCIAMEKIDEDKRGWDWFCDF